MWSQPFPHASPIFILLIFKYWIINVQLSSSPRCHLALCLAMSIHPSFPLIKIKQKICLKTCGMDQNFFLMLLPFGNENIYFCLMIFLMCDFYSQFQIIYRWKEGKAQKDDKIIQLSVSEKTIPKGFKKTHLKLLFVFNIFIVSFIFQVDWCSSRSLLIKIISQRPCFELLILFETQPAQRIIFDWSLIKKGNACIRDNFSTSVPLLKAQVISKKSLKTLKSSILFLWNRLGQYNLQAGEKLDISNCVIWGDL